MGHIPGGWSGFGADIETGGSGGARSSGQKYASFDYFVDRLVGCPWPAAAGSISHCHPQIVQPRRPLYTPEERRRRDSTAWTTVQGVLAPIQFAVFIVSLGLVLNYLATGHGYAVATASIILKTVILYVIMLTGSIWEKKVFGKFLFAPAFFWEDVFSILVLTLHTTYLVKLITGDGSAQALMLLALAAYASYAINATQFVLKLRAARLDAPTAHLAAGRTK